MLAGYAFDAGWLTCVFRCLCCLSWLAGLFGYAGSLRFLWWVAMLYNLVHYVVYAACLCYVGWMARHADFAG
jgi:hypothetical protein